VLAIRVCGRAFGSGRRSPISSVAIFGCVGSGAAVAAGSSFGSALISVPRPPISRS
jgi:hypothetical protein